MKVGSYDQIVSAIVEGANLSLYNFDLFKIEKSNKKQPDLTIIPKGILQKSN